ncbi:acyl-CoA dehydrogenase family protein [Sulfitobacter sp. F26169L]|uniref:acyl-CoA dehydrogenase family protein n=1 Tax=Sulfitobacter sp. F26169L TaxID=2996015 RepID=UPI002260E7E7|nr:acyl-CoA dehydrogenase family protein [Sulfitobacter sp. F26169L]MCX7567749.1 acyl-CoA dehydrogenase family protein [Sulfitobacter sp. F26169L]
MEFSHSPRSREYLRLVSDFMDNHIAPRNASWHAEVAAGNYPVSFMADLKALAKSEGLWNLFLPSLKHDEPGQGLSTLDYAPIAEVMGWIPWASEVFNCSAPDTGNMELLHLFATVKQRENWLMPLLEGEIRSAFAMSEPDVPSSDATNIQTSIKKDGNGYTVSGRKWFITNAAHPDCKLLIVMGKTDFGAPRHLQQSMVLVPIDTPGVEIKRNIPVLNHHTPEGHCEILFSNVKVPADNLLGGEGEGFQMAQARLGPGRIHHCMRSIGQAELALALMCDRAKERKTFGSYLSDRANVADWVAHSRLEIEQARLLVLKAAWMIDTVGVESARAEISMIKALVPSMLCRVTDRAMQTFGAMGMSPDTPLAEIYTFARALRFADGPDEVHLRSIAKGEFKASSERFGASAKYMTPPMSS